MKLKVWDDCGKPIFKKKGKLEDIDEGFDEFIRRKMR